MLTSKVSRNLFIKFLWIYPNNPHEIRIYQYAHPIGSCRLYSWLFLTFISYDVQELHSYSGKCNLFKQSKEPSHNLLIRSSTRCFVHYQKLVAILIYLQKMSSSKFAQFFCYEWMSDCCSTSKIWILQEVRFYVGLIQDLRDLFLIVTYHFFPIHKLYSFLHFKHCILKVEP